MVVLGRLGTEELEGLCFRLEDQEEEALHSAALGAECLAELPVGLGLDLVEL